jgi:hypothetical protein
MNFLNEIYWDIKWKIEDAFNAIKDKFNKNSYEVEPFVGEYNDNEISASWEDEEIEVKPKKKKAKKKSVKKAKKSV